MEAINHIEKMVPKMTLRDYIAAQLFSGNLDAVSTAKVAAIKAYYFADVMLEIRKLPVETVRKMAIGY